ncbi:polyprenyl synthetase family protein, partial [Turicibacter sanguinis]|nr:polyprenyl synthetase family protein [Turicibacter sanguinis]
MLSTYIETNKKPFEKVMFDLIESEPIPSELKES